ncbi:HAMP domain-containing protein [candidate division KSB1 bacterium]|nr:HAMP domain-containing protein [candidate division KSB1 bacterium]
MSRFRIRPFQWSLRLKAIIVFILLHSILVSILIFYTISGHHKMVEELTKEHFADFVEMVAPLFTDLVNRNDLESIRLSLDGFQLSEEIVFAAVYDKNNTLIEKRIAEEYTGIFDSVSEEHLKEYPDSLYIHEIGRPGGFFHREGHFFELSVPMFKEGEYTGKIQVGISTTRINQRVAAEGTSAIQIIFISIAVGMIIIALIDQRIKKILQGLIATTDRMAGGDLQKRVNVHTGDELEVLGNSFNIMADKILERESVIERHKNHLEELVEQRTSELAKERDKLQTVLDNVPSAIIMLDNTLKVQMVNAQFESIMNIPVKNILGKHCSGEICYLCEDDFCLVKQCLEEGAVKVESTYHKGDLNGDEYFEHFAIPLLHGKKTYGVLEIITDVTEKYNTQRHLIRAEKLSTTGEMAATLAHEIRNSNTSVKMILQLLKERSSDADLESIGVALDSITQVEQIVNDLIHFSKPTEIDFSTQDLNELLKSSVQFAAHQFQDQDIDVKMDFDQRVSNISCDKNHMHKVVVNLVLNAAQSITGSGRIVISTEKIKLDQDIYDYASLPAEAREITSSASVQKIILKKGSDVALIKVSDTGEGIPRTNIQRIFDPFFTTKVNGTGLGLSLAKRIVNAHNGIITVQSVQNEGTTLSIFLPYHATSTPQ